MEIAVDVARSAAAGKSNFLKSMDDKRMKEKAEPGIAVGDCKHGYTYRVRARNFRIGVFDSSKGRFAGIRHKFGNRFLDWEQHWDNGAPYGTVHVVAELEQTPVNFGDEQVLFSYLDRAEKRFPEGQGK